MKPPGPRRPPIPQLLQPSHTIVKRSTQLLSLARQGTAEPQDPGRVSVQMSPTINPGHLQPAQHTYILASPDLDGSVLRRGVEQPVSAPLHACDRLRVPSEDLVAPAPEGVPDPDAAILGGTGQVAAFWISGEGRRQSTVLEGPLQGL